MPSRTAVVSVSEGLAADGEREGRERLTAWLSRHVDADEDRHDDLADDATFWLSPYLHFGAVSATRPRAATEDYRTRHGRHGREPPRCSTSARWRGAQGLELR